MRAIRFVFLISLLSVVAACAGPRDLIVLLPDEQGKVGVVTVENDSGDVANWGMELASPNLLMRQGWARSAMKVGDAITVEGFLARDGSNTGNARTITIDATGKTLTMQTSVDK